MYSVANLENVMTKIVTLKIMVLKNGHSVRDSIDKTNHDYEYLYEITVGITHFVNSKTPSISPALKFPFKDLST